MHEKWQDLIPFYVAGSLSERDIVELERHLSQCATCQKVVDEWRMIGDAVRTEADMWSKKLPPLSPQVRASLHAAHADDYDTVPTSPISFPSQDDVAALPRRRSWQVVTAAAAVVIVVIFGGLLALMVTRGQHKGDDIGVVAAAPTDTKAAQQGDFVVTVSPTPMIVGSPEAANQDLGIILGTPTPVPTIITTSTPRPLPSATSLPQEETQLDQFNMAAPVVESTLANKNGVFPTPTALNPEFILLTPPPDVCTVNSASGAPVNVYGAPDATSAIINTLPPGEYLYTMVVDGSGWYQVTGRGIGIIGWVWGNQINLNGNCNDLVLPSPTYNSNNIVTDAWGNTPTPTAYFNYSIGMGQYDVVTMEQIGAIPAGTRVNITAAWYDGVTWHYTVVNEQGASYEALQAQLAYAPDAVPGQPTPSS